MIKLICSDLDGTLIRDYGTLSEDLFEYSIRLNDDFESEYNKAESSEEHENLLKQEHRKAEAEVHLKSSDKILKEFKKK